MKLLLAFFIMTLCLCLSTFGKSEDKKKEKESVGFDAIKNVLKNDRLEKGVNKIIKNYDVPEEKEFWSFFSELWLVQNASILKWNFEKPDYGLGDYFKEFLEKQGILELNYKILIVDSPDISHYALPSNNEVIFLLGLPFVRAMDLSRLEISLLLFEDYLRHRYGYFKSYVSIDGVEKFLGSNLRTSKFNRKLVEAMKERYDELIFAKGFTFQQQYKVTSDMSKRLKSDLKIWNAYYKLISKKKNLVETNLIYKKYLKIYPSPELQLNWLNPVKKKIL
jgi:hypothetical protein